jgi:LCP family protein required for cell wall assembly
MEKDRFKKRRHISGRVNSGSLDGLNRNNDHRYSIPRRDFFEVYKSDYATDEDPEVHPEISNQSVPIEVEPPEILSQIVEPVDTYEEAPRTNSLIDLNLPGSSSIYHNRLVIKKPIAPIIRMWAFRASSAAIIITMIVGGLLFTQSYITLHKVLKGGAKTAAALQTNVDPSLLKGEGDGRINILLLGRGGGSHDGPDLTDTMMVASINPVNDTSTLISVPRDLWVDVPNQGAMKINAAWETGEFKYEGKIAPGSTNPNAIAAGYNEVDQVVENVLGITINYNMIADFQAFQQVVDTLGGITINVPTELYDPTMAWENGNNPVLASPGWQTFTGSQALNYVRSRETTSDFARAQRQRSMIVSIKQKAETLGVVSNPVKIAGLFSALGNNVSTDISLGDADKLYNVIKNINNSNVTSIGLAGAPNNYITTQDLNGQSIDVPIAGMFNYSAIQAFVRSQLQDPYILRENAPVLVLNGTTEQGLDTSMSTTLKSYGYNVVGSGDAPTTNYDQTMVIDLSGGKDPYTRHYLEQRFNTTAITSLPDKSIQTNGAKFVIILGNDETVNSQS